ncbi:MAG TPA: hypothetical protein VGI03_11845 [Verrucomicrobiae bacterium]
MAQGKMGGISAAPLGRIRLSEFDSTGSAALHPWLPACIPSDAESVETDSTLSELMAVDWYPGVARASQPRAE